MSASRVIFAGITEFGVALSDLYGLVYQGYVMVIFQWMLINVFLVCRSLLRGGLISFEQVITYLDE